MLLVFEDAHWSDPTSIELLDLIVEQLRTLPVLLIVSFRLEFVPPWTGATHATTLSLDRLDAADARAVVNQLRQATPLSAEAIDAVVAKADGVPLFLEELTKAVLEASRYEHVDGRTLQALHARGADRPGVPAGLPGARLDRLAPVREVAQTAACLGREFDHALLAAISPLPAPRLAEALEMLVSADLLFRVGGAAERPLQLQARPGARHRLCDTLKSRRQQLQTRIVAVIEAEFPERASAQPQLLAQHCAEAGLIGQAIEYWHRAGLSAARRSALKEAMTQFQEAWR